MKAQVYSITPEMAQDMLRRNSSNRVLRRSKVNQYANDMIEGNWSLTGQGITFNKNGMLLDGQHRLAAIIQSNKTVEMLVVTEADDSYMYDCGLKRSMSDQFRMSAGGSLADSCLSPSGMSAIRSIYLLNKYGYYDKKHGASAVDVSKIIEKKKNDITRLCNMFSNHTACSKGLKRSIVPATLYMIHCCNKDLTFGDISHILSVIFSGIPDGPRDNPILALRNKLIESSQNKSADNNDIVFRTVYATDQYLNKTETTRNIRINKIPYEFINAIESNEE